MNLPDLGIETGSPALQANSLPTELSGKLIDLMCRKANLLTLDCNEEKCLLKAKQEEEGTHIQKTPRWLLRREFLREV